MTDVGPSASGVQGLQAKRILILTDVLGGGTGNHLFALLKYFDQSRYQPTIITQNPRSDGATCPDAFTDVLPPRQWFDRYPIGQIHTVARLLQRTSLYCPDILHTYFFWSIIYGRLLKWMGRVQHLVENRENEGYDLGRQAGVLLRATRSLPDRVVCVSEAVRKMVLHKERLSPDKTVVIHNGIKPLQEPAKADPTFKESLGFPAHSLVVGMVANMNRSIKGVRYFVDAMRPIVEAIPNARFLIIGHGSERLALEEKVRSLGLRDHVVFTGYQRDVSRYYALMDVAVLTSLSEGLSIALLESMNHGLPTVVTRVGGNPELVIEGQTGFLVEPKNVPDFVARVVALLKDPDLRRHMGSAARMRVRDHFDIRQAATRYMDTYADVLSQAPSS